MQKKELRANNSNCKNIFCGGEMRLPILRCRKNLISHGRAESWQRRALPQLPFPRLWAAALPWMEPCVSHWICWRPTVHKAWPRPERGPPLAMHSLSIKKDQIAAHSWQRPTFGYHFTVTKRASVLGSGVANPRRHLMEWCQAMDHGWHVVAQPTKTNCFGHGVIGLD